MQFRKILFYILHWSWVPWIKHCFKKLWMTPCICIKITCTGMSYCLWREGNRHLWRIVYLNRSWSFCIAEKSTEFHTNCASTSFILFHLYILYVLSPHICIPLMFILFYCLWNCKPGTRGIKWRTKQHLLRSVLIEN